MGRTGRPREFDRGTALARAMELFWAHGYEATTLSDLQRAMGGITAPSFYAAFGSKEALFREAVKLYNDSQGSRLVKALTGGATARASIEASLRAATENFCRPGNPRGCLVVLSAINCMPANKGISNFMRAQRLQRDKTIQQRLRRGLEQGDVPRGADLSVVASFYGSVVDGLSIKARDGASRKVLMAIVDCAMASWDPTMAGG